jgi:hypothetical protein
LLLKSATAKPAGGAAALNLTVQEIGPAPVMLAGEHANPVSTAGATRATVDVCITAPAEAVITADWLDVTAVARAGTTADEAAGGTRTLNGTRRLVLLLERATAKPVAGAAPLKLTVHKIGPTPVMLAGEHANPVKVTALWAGWMASRLPAAAVAIGLPAGPLAMTPLT